MAPNFDCYFRVLFSAIRVSIAICILTVGSTKLAAFDGEEKQAISEPVIVEVEAEEFARQQKDDIRRWYRFERDSKLPDLEGAGKVDRWVSGESSAASTASGNAYVRILPDTRRNHGHALIRGENFCPDPGTMTILEYDVEFEKAGRYYVWARAFSSNSEDNGLHVGLNDEWPESGQRMQWCEGKHAWRWECAQRTNEKHCGEPMQIYLDVETPGRHKVMLSMREDGFALDKLLFSNDVDFRPKSEQKPAIQDPVPLDG